MFFGNQARNDFQSARKKWAIKIIVREYNSNNLWKSLRKPKSKQETIMSPQPKKPPGDSHVSLGQKSGKEKKKRSSGSVVHKAGKQTQAEHAAAEKGSAGVKRQSHKAPLALPKKGGS
jgi:hypothetical protein